MFSWFLLKIVFRCPKRPPLRGRTLGIRELYNKPELGELLVITPSKPTLPNFDQMCLKCILFHEPLAELIPRLCNPATVGVSYLFL
jgi:hypothetical protein